MSTGIICVDDEKIVIESIKNIFMRNFDSYIVEFAQSSNEVFEILEEFKEDGVTLALIISDYIMPGTKGDQLLISVNEEFPEAKKIMLTGQADLAAVENAVNKANLYRYISKPWENSDLTLTIKEALKSYENEQKIKAHTHELEKKIKERTKQLSESLGIINEHVINITTDKNFNIISYSKAFSMFFDNCDFINNNIETLIPEELNSNLKYMFEDSLKGKSWKGELQVKKRNSETKWMATSCTPFSSSSRNEYNLVMHDITDKKEIEKMLVIDPMTGLYNRRFFYEHFPRIINEAKKNQQGISFILLDIDKFKQYNDLYGHQKGDTALTAISTFLNSKLKTDNYHALRLGGEEFAIIIKELNCTKLPEYCEELRAGIETLKIPHEANPSSKYITASFGALCIEPNDKTDLDYFYAKADKLLYLAKENGRNNIKFDA